MPATDWRKIEKAATELEPDTVCMDLEDGVALNRKDEARQTALNALNSLDFGRSERLVRINAPDSEIGADADLDVILAGHPDGIVVPKCRSGNHIKALHERLAGAEHRFGFAAGSIKLLLIIETARGVVLLDEIYKASHRTEALLFGAEDFSSDIGATRTASGHEVLYARSKVVTYAKAAGLQAIDIVHPDFRDVEGFQAQAQQGLEMGFTGKQLIHPNQVEQVHSVYQPDADAVLEAKKIVEAHAAHQASGAGAFALDGKMIDMPVVRQAELILQRDRYQP
jgi:citrate lyase beta subunit